jgi:DNA-binding transcriptional ArsR family regulator
MARPFEGLFGDTSELRLIQFFLPLRGLEFNISELAKESRVSRQTMSRVVKKLVGWGVLKVASKQGRINYYALNEDTGFLEALENLNNCIIEQMLGDEMLTRIANYSLEHTPVCACAVVEGAWDSVESSEGWYPSFSGDGREKSSSEKPINSLVTETEVALNAAA